MVEAPDVPVSKWPRRLVIVRHAESEANLRRLYLEREASQDMELGLGMRDADVPLTEHGRKQAEATGRALNADDPFAVVYVSPYRRTQETAERLVSQLAARPRPVLEERLREKEYGIFEGLTKHGCQVRYPDEWARRTRIGKYYYRPPGGESFPDVNLRVHSFLGTLIREHAGEHVLVVTHSVVVLSFRRLLERMEEQEVLALDQQDEVKNAAALVYEVGSRDGREGVLVRTLWNRTYWDEPVPAR
jgi:broad specificity phosphatase PhoE